MTAHHYRALALVCVLAAAPVAAHQAPPAPAPTRIVRFTPPEHLPSRTAAGDCAAGSVVAAYRTDAFGCTGGGEQFDPCFKTSRAGHVLCDVDPRDPSSGLLLKLTSALPGTSERIGRRTSAVWFVELTDGTTCKPLPTPGRVVEGMTELYTCRFAIASGDVDAVLGDVDQRTPVWTVQKVQINKKIEPQTIKSATSAAVRTAWQ